MKKIIILIFLGSIYANSTEHNQVEFTLFYGIPFLGILLSIALIPLINHHFWERHFGKVSLFWSRSGSVLNGDLLTWTAPKTNLARRSKETTY